MPAWSGIRGTYVCTTPTHEAMGNLGLVVVFERGHIIEWTLASDYLAGHPAWTSADIGKVADIVMSPTTTIVPV